MSKEQAKAKIQKILDRYQNLTPSEMLMNEENTKTKFIRPLFETLGWDFEEDVILEDKVSRGRVDYNFQINGHTKFFLEAKPIKANIDDPEYAKQATNYAWLKNVNWAILCDFEGIRVFYPATEGKAKSCFRINWQNYLKDFEDLWILSRESFEKNLLDEKAIKWGAKPEKTKVSSQLAQDLNIWRDDLYNHFKLWNENLSDTELDEGVQKILDRFIFIRTCEDRGLENKSLRSEYRIWQDNGRKGNFLAYLISLFNEYQKIYNSGLFEPHPCINWEISSECFDKIIPGLYQSPVGQDYDFSAIDADALGAVYEQYLGHLLKKSKDGDKEKKKRKSQGIYYTPTFIVEYIVQNTLGKLLKEKSSQEIKNLKILDPACGSGSFLIKAYEYLENYHFNKQNQQKFAKDSKLGKIEQTFKNQGKYQELSSAQLNDILRENIYGVDLDDQAVEIAQLNLLLKTAISKHKLPHLTNIKCGNSLIDDSKIVGDKAFNWNDQFSEVMNNGGFDIVIGNPPYIDSESMVKNMSNEREFISSQYRTAKGNWDLYVPFFEKAINLLKNGGIAAFITPNKWLSIGYAHELRMMLNKSIYKICDCSDIKVFKDAGNSPVITFLIKDNKRYDIKIQNFNDMMIIHDKNIISYNDENLDNLGMLLSKNLNILMEIQKIKTQVSDYCSVENPFSVSEAYILKQHILDNVDKRNNFKFINTGTIDRYCSKWNYKLTSYIKNKYHHPSINMSSLKKIMPKRYEQSISKKIIISGIRYFECFYDKKGEYVAGKSTIIIREANNTIKLPAIMAILNSKLINFYIKQSYSAIGIDGGINYNPKMIKSIPIPLLDKSIQSNLIDLVYRIQNDKVAILKVKQGTNRWNQLKSEIFRTDKRIDQKVYELYRLDKKEISIIEKS